MGNTIRYGEQMDPKHPSNQITVEYKRVDSGKQTKKKGVLQSVVDFFKLLFGPGKSSRSRIYHGEEL